MERSLFSILLLCMCLITQAQINKQVIQRDLKPEPPKELLPSKKLEIAKVLTNLNNIQLMEASSVSPGKLYSSESLWTSVEGAGIIHSGPNDYGVIGLSNSENSTAFVTLHTKLEKGKNYLLDCKMNIMQIPSGVHPVPEDRTLEFETSNNNQKAKSTLTLPADGHLLQVLKIPTTSPSNTLFVSMHVENHGRSWHWYGCEVTPIQGN